jgi:flagellar M-ring protein FliF
MGGLLLKLRTWWETADKTTKTVTMVGLGLFATLLVVVFYLSSSPDLKLLYGGLDETERGRVVQKLQELKIPYKVDANGDILAPSSQLAEVRAKLAMSGIPSSGGGGNGRMDQISPTTPSAVMDQQLLVAKEEELEKTIAFMSPVMEAKVHIAPGNDSPFADSKAEPSASVVVKLAPGVTGAGEVAESIVRIVSTSVPGLDQKNVSVSSADGQILWDGKEESDGGAGIATKKRAAELQESQRLKRDIETMIARTVGPGKAIVSVNVQMNFNREDVETVSEKADKPVPMSETKEAYGPDAANQLASGSSSTAGQPTTPPTGTGATGAKSYAMTTQESAVPITHEKKQTSVAPGTTTACRVSIMLDESVADQKSKVEAYASNLISADKDPENFKVSVSTAKFDTAVLDAAKKELAGAKSGQMMQQIISLIPVVALIVVGFLVIKSIGKAASGNANVLIAAHSGGGYTPIGGARAAVQQPQTGTAIQSSAAPASLQNEPEQSFRPQVQEADRPQPIVIQEKYDENLEAILHMADRKPEKIALLIKSWILEETK